jgi:tripartite-type tricarboxylate transporter receptor subunit TctC
MDRRRFVTRTGALLGAPFATAFAARVACAQAWPARPIRLYTQDAPGGAIDARLREFALPLADELKGTLVVENKVGAGGQIAHQALLTAPPDGYTMMLANAAITIIPSLYRKLPYVPTRDFVPVAYSGLSAVALAVSASTPARTLKEWTAWAGTRKGKLNYASSGVGSVQHLYGYQLEQQLGIDASHVPYKTAIQFLPDLATGQIQFTMLDIFSLRPFLQKGDVRLLAVTGRERSRFLPDVPTFRELGMEGYERMGWTAYFMRSGTPQPVIDRMADAIDKVNALPEWVAKREATWSTYEVLSRAQLADRVMSETGAWGELIRRTGASLD